jgi:hypothetical protein
MNNLAKGALVGIAVLVVVVAAAMLIPSSGPGAASPNPSLAASPTALPTGTSAWRADGHQLLASVPATWIASSGGAGKHPDEPGELGIGIAAPVSRVYSDACASEGALDPVGTSVSDLVRALDEQRSTDATV